MGTVSSACKWEWRLEGVALEDKPSESSSPTAVGSTLMPAANSNRPRTMHDNPLLGLLPAT